MRYILPKSIRNAVKGHSPQPVYKQLSKAERKGKTWQEIKEMREGQMIRFCVGLFTALISGITIFEACTKNLEPAPPTHEIAISIVFLCLVFVAGVMLMFPWFQKMREKRKAEHAKDE